MPITAESKHMQAFVAYDQNTHDTYVSRSIAVLLWKLKDQYFPDRQADYTAVIESSIASFAAFLDVSGQEYRQAFEGFKDILSQPMNQLDHANILQPDQSGGMQSISLGFPLKEVFTLVYQALTDSTVYPKEHKQEQDDEIFRLRTLAAEIQWLTENGICHQGVRHGLALTLVGVYPDSSTRSQRVEIIEDVNSFILATIKAVFSDRLNPIKRSSDWNYYRLLCLWQLAVITGDAIPAEITREVLSNEGLIEIINEKLMMHGIDPNDRDIQKKRDDIIAYIAEIDPPLGEDVWLHDFKRICETSITQQESSVLPRNTALEALKRRIALTLMNTVIDAQQLKLRLAATLKSFICVDQCYFMLKQGAILRQFNAEAPAIITRYFKQFVPSNSEPIADWPALSEQEFVTLEGYLSASKQYLQSMDYHWITNFFAIFFSVEQHNLEQYTLRQDELLKLFALAISDESALSAQTEHAQTKILVTDTWLKEIFVVRAHVEYQQQEESKEPITVTSVTLKPYEVNRLLLHACLQPPAQWSEPFFACLSRVVNLIEGGSEDNILLSELKQASYPDQFIRQIRQLLSYYQTIHLPAEEVAAEIDSTALMTAAAGPMLLFYRPLDVVDLSTVLKSFGSNRTLLTTYCQKVGSAYLSSVLYMVNGLLDLCSLCPDQCIVVLQSFKDADWRRIIPTSIALANLRRIDNHENFVTVLNLLGTDYLREIVSTVDELIELCCLKDYQKQIVSSTLGSDHLVSMIHTITELSKIDHFYSSSDAVINALEENRLRALVSTVTDLERLYFDGSPQLVFLIFKRLGIEYLCEMTSTVILVNTFPYLVSYIVKEFGIEYLRRVMPTITEFEPICHLDQHLFFSLMEIFGQLKYMPEIVRTATDLAELRFSGNKFGMVLWRLGTDYLHSIVPTFDELAKLHDLSEYQFTAVLQCLGSDYLYQIIPDRYLSYFFTAYFDDSVPLHYRNKELSKLFNLAMSDERSLALRSTTEPTSMKILVTEKILVTDTWLEALSAKLRSSVDATTPDEVNRLLLHACLRHPAEWSELFVTCLSKIVHLLSDIALPDSEHNLYPQSFIQQIQHLLSFYQMTHQSAESKAEDLEGLMIAAAAGPMPLFYWPQNIVNLVSVLLAVDSDLAVDNYCQRIGFAHLINILPDFTRVKQLICSCPKQHNRVLNFFGNDYLRKIVPSATELAQLCDLPPYEVSTLIAKLGGDHLLMILSQDGAWAQLKDLPESTFERIVRELAYKLNQILWPVKNLVQLKDLPESIFELIVKNLSDVHFWVDFQAPEQLVQLQDLSKDQFVAVLNQLGVNRLRDIASRSTALSQLHNLSEDKFIAVIDRLGVDFLRTMIATTGRLSALNNFSAGSVAAVLNQLGVDHLRGIVSRPTALLQLYYLSEENFVAVINQLGDDFLRTMMSTVESLSALKNDLSEDSFVEAKKFSAVLDRLGANHLLHIVSTPTALSQLCDLSEDKFIAVFNQLGARPLCTQVDTAKLRLLLTTLSGRKFRYIFKEMSFTLDFFMQLLGSGKFKQLLPLENGKVNSLVKLLLEKYIASREGEAHKHHFYSFYNKDNKLRAARHLLSSLESGSPPVPVYCGALRQGRLGNIYQMYREMQAAASQPYACS